MCLDQEFEIWEIRGSLCILSLYLFSFTHLTLIQNWTIPSLYPIKNRRDFIILNLLEPTENYSVYI